MVFHKKKLSTIRQFSGHIAVVPLALFLHGCSDNGSREPLLERESVRNTRYCELLLVDDESGQLNVRVYNTIGFNNCPGEVWDALDVAQIGMEVGVDAVIRNGPRHLLMDEVSGSVDNVTDVQIFDGVLEMGQVATFQLDTPTGAPNNIPYRERIVNRATVFVFHAGREVYELTAPSGRTYIMQSYAVFVDTSLNQDSLPDLGSRLELPEGWSWRSYLLDEDLILPSESAGAVVVQDELANTYQRIPRPKDTTLLEFQASVPELNNLFANHFYGCDCTVDEYDRIGPPEGYDAALRAVRVFSSITGNVKVPAGVSESFTADGFIFNYLATSVAGRVLGMGATGPFVTVKVQRSTVFTYDAGSVAHELTDSDGNRYILFSTDIQMLDATGINLSQRDALAGLSLPAGWSYASRVLDEPLIVDSFGEATVFGVFNHSNWQRY